MSKYIHKYNIRNEPSERNQRNQIRMSRKYDGADSSPTIKYDLSKKLNNIKDYSKLNYNYDIDFTKEPEYKELILEKDLNKIKIKLDIYINMVKNSVLYPSDYLKNFKNRYLNELLKIKDNINESLYTKNIINKPIFFRNESYGEIVSENPNKRKYVHTSDKRKSRVVVNNKVFDI